MADAVWPAGLDSLAPQLVSWTKTEPTLTERTQMSAGPAKVRRRFTAGVTLHTVELVLTRDQLTDTFRPFWMDTLQGGALAFEWRDWETQDPAEFRFIAPPVERPLRPRGSGTNDHWAVSFQLEQLPAALAGPVTPPAPENEPPPVLVFDATPTVAFDVVDAMILLESDYTPAPNDPDETPQVFETVPPDQSGFDQPPLTVLFDDIIGAAGATATPELIVIPDVVV